MKHFNLLLGIVSIAPWIALYILYYRESLFPWLANRFTRDKLPKQVEIEDGYFPDGVPIPFRENLYPSAKPVQPESPRTEGSPAKSGAAEEKEAGQPAPADTSPKDASSPTRGDGAEDAARQEKARSS